MVFAKIYKDQQTGLYEIDDLSLIPEGLIPEAKLKDKAQLSTVLHRIITLHNLLESQFPIFIFCKTKARAQAANESATVDDAVLQTLLAKYPSLKLIEADYPKELHAANYYDGNTMVCIAAAQIQSNTEKWGVYAESENMEYKKKINTLLNNHGFTSIDEMVQQYKNMKQSTATFNPGMK